MYESLRSSHWQSVNELCDYVLCFLQFFLGGGKEEFSMQEELLVSNRISNRKIAQSRHGFQQEVLQRQNKRLDGLNNVKPTTSVSQINT